MPATGTISQLQADLEGMNLIPTTSAASIKGSAKEEDTDYIVPLPSAPIVSLATEKILELAREREKDEKPVLSLVVVGTFPFLLLLAPPHLTHLLIVACACHCFIRSCRRW